MSMLNKQYLIPAAIIAVGIILASVIFRGCDHSPVHKDDVKQTEQEQAELKEKDKQATINTTHWKNIADSLQRANVDLQARLDVYKKEATTSREKAGKLVKELDRAKADKDTGAYVQTCDTLQKLVQDQALTISGYMELVDSTTANYQAQIDYKDSIINEQIDLLSAFREANSKLEDRYYEINKDYSKVTKKLKRERTLGRLLAIAGAVLGGALLIK